ncbi:hypothetical protein, partial [Salmonella enterica]
LGGDVYWPDVAKNQTTAGLNMCMDNCRRRPDKAFTPPSGIMPDALCLSGLQTGLRGRTCFIAYGR